MKYDSLIVGGGVIGLSLAYELATRGEKVRVIDRGPLGGEASWAGAGIIPPAATRGQLEPIDRLLALSCDLHAAWAERLREETGVDNGYRRCGAVYVARGDEDARQLHLAAARWRSQGIAVEPAPPERLAQIEPALAKPRDRRFAAAHWLAGEAQIRNPRHLKALVAACAARGVELTPCLAAESMATAGRRATAINTSRGAIEANRVCLTSGAWTGELLTRLGMPTAAVRPVRGQIALLKCRAPALKAVVNEGKRYLVPRDDGRVLVGSTEEEVGFDKSTTAAGTSGLLKLAIELVPDLAEAEVERTWAGLRPATRDGLPVLGRVADFENLYVAAGHFRAGLQLSTGTALVMARLMRGEPTVIDLDSFRADRAALAR